MKPFLLPALFCLLLLAAGARAGQEAPACRLMDAQTGQTLTPAQAVPRLSAHRIILVGEHHTREGHHACQLAVIRALHEAGIPMAIGMEMFRHDSQPALDQWIAGRMDQERFMEVYAANWNYPWALYAEILMFARENRIPVVGLNVPPEITRQVARRGFDSLSAEQKENLAGVACRVDPPYMDYIAKVHGAHAHGNMDFTHFCQAQMVWDTAMAVRALSYLEANPGKTLVILAGGAHAQKMGIPRQVADRSDLSPVVLLPRDEVAPAGSPFGTDAADFIFTVENGP